MAVDGMGAATRESLRLRPEQRAEETQLVMVRSRRQDALMALRESAQAHRRVVDAFGLLIDQDPDVDGGTEDGMGVNGDDFAIAAALQAGESANADLLRILAAIEGKAALAASVAELVVGMDVVAPEPGMRDARLLATEPGCRTCGAVPGREHDGAAHDAMALRGKPFLVQRMMVAENGERYLVTAVGGLVPTHAGEAQGTAVGPGLDPKGVALRNGALRELYLPGSPEPFGVPDAGTVFVLSEVDGPTGAVAFRRRAYGKGTVWVRDHAPGEPSDVMLGGASWTELNMVELVSVVRVTP